MGRFADYIAPYVDEELRASRVAGSPALAFAHLERAHVLGQASTYHHVRVHWHMLRWGLRQRQPREVLGQIARLVGAATKTAIGLVPTGNTGGANISAVKRLEIAPDLAEILRRAKD